MSDPRASEPTTPQSNFNAPNVMPPVAPPNSPPPYNYGYMIPYPPPMIQPSYQMIERVEKEVNQLPLISMILSIVAVPFLFTAPRTGGVPYFTAFISLVAIVFGHLSLAIKPSAETARGNSMAITGLIIGYFLLAISLVVLILQVSA